MKQPSLRLAFVVIALTFSNIVNPQQLVAQQPKKPSQVLYDFRVTPASDPSRIPVGTQRRVLLKVFRRYLTDESKCNPNLAGSGDSDPLRAARNAGQIVPAIAEMATGSFTAAGRTETLYVILVGECNATHADNFGTKRVAIFASEQLVANVDVDFKDNIARKTDLDGDGVNELLMTSGDMHQGILTEMAALLEFRNGRVRVIEDFGIVTEDSCASLIPGSAAKASVVSMSDVVPGRMPRLRIDNYQAGCRKIKRWRFISSGRMQ